LANVNLQFWHLKRETDSVLPFLTNVLPLFTSVNSIYCFGGEDIISRLQNEYFQLAWPMMTSARFLNIWSEFFF
jgi:hypothetical protein